MNDLIHFLSDVLLKEEIYECLQLLENENYEIRLHTIIEFLNEPSIHNKIHVKYEIALVSQLLTDNHLLAIQILNQIN
jgi:hypothetical protein